MAASWEFLNIRNKSREKMVLTIWYTVQKLRQNFTEIELKFTKLSGIISEKRKPICGSPLKKTIYRFNWMYMCIVISRIRLLKILTQTLGLQNRFPWVVYSMALLAQRAFFLTIFLFLPLSDVKDISLQCKQRSICPSPKPHGLGP